MATKILFSANDGTHGFELWVTDGTAAGTALVTDINPGAGSSYASGLTALGDGTALFSANDGTHGIQLWVTDGTAAGTALADGTELVGSPPPSHMTALGNGKAVFAAYDRTYGRELWVTDGTASGTALVKDIYGGDNWSLNYFDQIPERYPRSSNPANITALGNGKAVFTAADGSTATDRTLARELWVTDGTTAGTAQVMDYSSGPSSASGFTALGNGKAVFSAKDGTHGFELWVTDGTAAGTGLVKDINPGGTGSALWWFTAIGDGKAMFSANDGTHGYELWVTDGTPGGTALLDDIVPGLGSSNPSGFTDILVPCYCRGTLILTDCGEVAVEELAIGDRVVTLSGEAKPIRWIGRRAYDPRFIAGNRTVLPVKIEAGALAYGIPARDLWISPEHALYIDGMLVPARLLANGATVRQVESIENLEYFHIELDTHDLILAERAPAETFVDCDNRGMFHNNREFAALYPDDMPIPWQFCAPRVGEDSAELTAIRRMMVARAKLFDRVTGDPDLHLIVDGEIVRPQFAADQTVYRFAILAGARSVSIASRSAVPAEVEISSSDHRRLGVAVVRIVLRGPGLRTVIEHDCPMLSNGFHQDEASHRWTDGRGYIPEALLTSFGSDLIIEVHHDETELRYGLETPIAAAIVGKTRAAYQPRSGNGKADRARA